MTIRQRLAKALFGDIIDDTAQRAALAVRDDLFAHLDHAASATELDWITRAENLDDALEAWRINPFARRVVNLHTSHVIGRRMAIGHARPDLDRWVRQWWNHPRNNVPLEIYNWADELCRAGELFFLIFTNPHDGMPYVRSVPARRILAIETDPDDYRTPLRFGEATDPAATDLSLRWWHSHHHPAAQADPSLPVMVHFAINRPAGAVRSWGGDLDPMLPWLRRYTEWLKDRVRSNASRNAWAWKMTAASSSRVAELAERYRGGLGAGSVWIGTTGEDLTAVSAHVDAADAAADGRALRQAIAVGGGVPPYMLGDSEGTNRTTAHESSVPTFQWWTTRQILFVAWLKELATVALQRAHALGRFRHLPRDLDAGWTHEVADLTRDDNLALAQSAATIVTALATMHANGWIDRESAIMWAAKFAGETLNPDAVIAAIDTDGAPPARTPPTATNQPGSPSAAASD